MCSRCRRSLLHKLVHSLNDKENAKSNNNEIDNSLNESAVIDYRRLVCETPRNSDMESAEVDTTDNGTDKRHKNLVNECRYY